MNLCVNPSGIYHKSNKNTSVKYHKEDTLLYEGEEVE